jgi:hypothetical protein
VSTPDLFEVGETTRLKGHANRRIEVLGSRPPNETVGEAAGELATSRRF